MEEQNPKISIRAPAQGRYKLIQFLNDCATLHIMQDPKKLINSQDVSAAENKEAMPVEVPRSILI